MAVYKNTTPHAQLAAVEFTPVSDGNFTFFYIAPREDKGGIKSWAESLGQEVVAETTFNGQQVLITQGSKSQEEIVKALEERGDKMQLHIPEKPLNLWKWRGTLSMIGHPMQLISGFLQKGPPDISTIGFATLNLAANLTNIIFGAQKSPDEHRLRFLKGKINYDVDEHLAVGDTPIGIHEKRFEARVGPEPEKSLGGKFHDFMQRNSVSFGEIGLRYLGGLSLVMPITKTREIKDTLGNVTKKQSFRHWKDAFDFLKKGSFKEAFKTIKNPDKFTFIAGLFWLMGKNIAFTAKTPDPYNPEPHTALDDFREKYAFKISTATEAVGALTLAGNRLFSENRRIVYPTWKVIPPSLRGKQSVDYMGGIGGLLFALAFVMRFSAPYGIKEVNMNELNAHVTDSLAKCPPEKIPQLMADNAAYLVENLKDKNLQFGEVFTEMTKDFYKYHDIATSLKNPASPPKDGVIDDVKEITAAALGRPPRKPLERVPAPAASHAEKAAERASEPSLSLGA